MACQIINSLDKFEVSAAHKEYRCAFLLLPFFSDASPLEQEQF